MSKFVFTKRANTTDVNVWCDQVMIGELSFSMREDPNIDWSKYRADKTLRLSFGERWSISWKAHTGHNMVNIGSFNTKEDAAQAILDEHHRIFNLLNNAESENE